MAGIPAKGTPEYDLWLAAVEVAISAPLKGGTNVFAAQIPWTRIHELREALDKVGVDWQRARVADQAQKGAQVNRTELAAQLDPNVGAVARTARKPRTCVGKREIRKYVITTVHTPPLKVHGTFGAEISETSSEAYSPEKAEELADRSRRRYPSATVTIEPRRNPNYRPDCLGEICPGDLYVDYISEAGFAQSGSPYCVPCGIACWGRYPDPASKF